MIKKIFTMLENTKKATPLVHHITNYVTVNDCANACLAIGGSPIMADDKHEVCDITSISKCLVINMGTLNERTVESMILAGTTANKCEIPVVFDPVGAGASKFRNETVASLCEKVKFDIVRGNLSEIRYVLESNSSTKGVDVSADDLQSDAVLIAKNCAKKLGCVVGITGQIDVISDGEKTICIENGNALMSKITGTGCMCNSLIGAFAGANSDKLLSTVGGILCMSLAGEIAYENYAKNGTGSYRVGIIDCINKMDLDTLLARTKIYEK